jgi:hypothetical protein
LRPLALPRRRDDRIVFDRQGTTRGSEIGILLDDMRQAAIAVSVSIQ